MVNKAKELIFCLICFIETGRKIQDYVNEGRMRFGEYRNGWEM
jgi:hypothetical protein